MEATAAGWDVQHKAGREEPRSALWRNVARALSVVLGLAGSAAVLVFGGLLALLTGCLDNGETTAFCPGSEDLASALEVIVLVPGILAPLAGGIASCVTSRPRWIAGGVAVGALMMWLLWLLVSGQQGLLS